jgi:hypothetical protein
MQKASEELGGKEKERSVRKKDWQEKRSNISIPLGT